MMFVQRSLSFVIAFSCVFLGSIANAWNPPPPPSCHSSPTATPTPVETTSCDATPTPLPTWTNTHYPTSTNTPYPTSTNTPYPTSTNTPYPTSTETPYPTHTPYCTHTPYNTHTPLPSFTATPHYTPTSAPSWTPTSYPSKTATSIPSWTHTAYPSKTSTQTPTPSGTSTSVPSYTQTATPTGTATGTSTSIPSWTPTNVPSETPTQVPTSTATWTPTKSKLPCHIHVSRRGKHPTSRWWKQGSPYSNVQYPSTVTLTIGGASAGVWSLDPCNREYAHQRECKSWQSDPPATINYGGLTYTIIGANNAIGGECSLEIGELVSPLVIDFKGGGVYFTKFPTAKFNFGDGREPTYWIQNADDVGFLAIDKNDNRRIDNINELFGDKTASEDNVKYANGFEALAAYDTNKNGEIDKRDAEFSKLKIWFDRNRNGLTEAGELERLESAGIEAISLKYEHMIEFADGKGNFSKERSMVFLKDGAGGLGIYDVYFARLKLKKYR